MKICGASGRSVEFDTCAIDGYWLALGGPKPSVGAAAAAG
jgi:hypothetical protein